MGKLLLLLLLLGQVSLGQNKSLHIPRYSNGDTSFWYSYKLEKDSIWALTKLETSKEYFHFRFRTEIQTIDILVDSNLLTQGTITNIGEFISERSNKKDAKIYKEIRPLESDLANELKKLIDSLDLKNISSEENIPGWGKMLDGITYLIEFSSPSGYSLKYYGNPESQKNIIEAEKIDLLVEFLDKKLKRQNSWLTFISTLPKGCYHAGSYYATCNSKKKKRN